LNRARLAKFVSNPPRAFLGVITGLLAFFVAWRFVNVSKIPTTMERETIKD
jgi:hypothetical protein